MTYGGNGDRLFILGYFSSGSWDGFNGLNLNRRSGGSDGFGRRHYENVTRELKRYVLGADT